MEPVLSILYRKRKDRPPDCDGTGGPSLLVAFSKSVPNPVFSYQMSMFRVEIYQEMPQKML